MTKRERDLEAKGYEYIKGFDKNDEAKAYASRMRSNGFKATVLSESRNGVYYYSVWAKKEV